MKLWAIISIVGLIISANAFAQTTPSDLYQYNYTTISPSFAGIEGQRMTFTGNIYVRKNGQYTGSGFLGYEARIDQINSGVGFSADFLNTRSRTQSNLNLLYNYQWSLDEGRKLVFGLKISDNQLSFDHSEITPMDPNDPIGYGGIVTASTTLGSAAVLYKGKKFFAGFSIDNLFHRTYRLHLISHLSGFHDPQYNMLVGREFHISERLSTTHSAYVINKNKFWRFDINNSMLINNWLVVGLSLEVNNSDHDNQIYPKANAGISIRKKAQCVFSVYSEGNNKGGKKVSGQMMLLFDI